MRQHGIIDINCFCVLNYYRYSSETVILLMTKSAPKFSKRRFSLQSLIKSRQHQESVGVMCVCAYNVNLDIMFTTNFVT